MEFHHCAVELICGGQARTSTASKVEKNSAPKGYSAVLTGKAARASRYGRGRYGTTTPASARETASIRPAAAPESRSKAFAHSFECPKTLC
jgi:hypothetical protein